jgi:hypothetical protein
LPGTLTLPPTTPPPAEEGRHFQSSEESRHFLALIELPNAGILRFAQNDEQPVSGNAENFRYAGLVYQDFFNPYRPVFID